MSGDGGPRSPRPPRNRSKADVRFEEREGRAVVVKDYRPRSWLVRVCYGRPTLRREARVYERLRDTPGIPRCLGWEGPDTLVLERAPGVSLDRLPASSVPPAIFDALDRVLATVHARGVAIADLHRSNVLIADDGRVHVIDFAIARLARDPARPGPLVRALQRLDRHAALRLRARAAGTPEPEPEGAWGAIYRAGKRVKRWLRRVRGR